MYGRRWSRGSRYPDHRTQILPQSGRYETIVDADEQLQPFREKVASTTMKKHGSISLGILVVVLCTWIALCQTSPDPLAEARRMMDHGSLAESETTLHAFLVGHPSDPEAHFLLGYVLFREQKARESLAEFTA